MKGLINNDDANMEKDFGRTKKEFKRSITLLRKDVDGARQCLNLRSKTIGVMESKVDLSKVDTFVGIDMARREMVLESKKILESIAEIKTTLIRYENDRFQMIVSALNAINNLLGNLYGRIVKNGDCFLSFACDRVSLFAEGVKLRAQHGTSSWQDVITNIICFFEIRLNDL